MNPAQPSTAPKKPETTGEELVVDTSIFLEHIKQRFRGIVNNFKGVINQSQ